MDSASANPNITKSLKKTCLKGLHAEDILFSSADGLDEFKTVYGNKPAVELSKGVLLQIFDVTAKYEEWQKIYQKIEYYNLKNWVCAILMRI